jgi:hypothetical protein
VDVGEILARSATDLERVLLRSRREMRVEDVQDRVDLQRIVTSLGLQWKSGGAGVPAS